MQHFINHAAIERATAEIFSSPRARYHLMGVIAIATAGAAGAALGAIWLGVALLIEEARKAMNLRVARLTPQDRGYATLALDIAGATSFASAPTIAWYARGELGAALAVGMLCALLINAAYSTRRGRLHTIAASAPYAFVGLMFLLEGAAAGVPWLVAVCGLTVAYVFASVLYHAHAAAHARMQDAEWVRQLNMSFGDSNAAAWEIDFARQRLVGAARLERLLGRPVSYTDIVDNGCFAGPADSALVRHAFAPQHGAMRRISLEHDAFRADGTSVRVSHQGFVRTTPDGTPTRITCVTRHSAIVARPMSAPQTTMAELTAALSSQEGALNTLGNELSASVNAELEGALANVAANVTEALHLIVERAAAIERGVDDLAHARHEADSANLAKSQFLANMSHELRTPLNAIIGYAEMLQEDAEDNGDTTAVQDLNRILTAAKHLLSLINEILDLSKIEAGRMDVVAAPFEPLQMLDELIETVRPLAEQNGNAILMAGAAPEGTARTDAFKLRQCVLNLLSNACKFTRDGKIEVFVDRRMMNGVEQMCVTVRDTGIGMSKEHISRLFQPFVQADPSITQQYGGTGLGLTITRRLAQLLGGDVKVESSLGHGSAFTLHVPVDFADASAALGAAATIDAVQGSQDAPLILVIEDEADARELAARALTRAGFAVQGVGGGEAGLALARAKAPALVLLDIFLPDRSGWRVLQSLKQDPKTQDIPVVVLSVNEDRAHALTLGAAEHIVKPADRDMLAATVMRYARKRPAPAQPMPSAMPTPIAEAG